MLDNLSTHESTSCKKCTKNKCFISKNTFFYGEQFPLSIEPATFDCTSGKGIASFTLSVT
jgi:hypothetical protein